MVVAPIVLGAEAGATTTLQTGHTYTLRLRFHCKDRQRALQSYSAGGANGPVQLGGQTLTAGADLVMELQETTGGAQFPVVVLYDGSVTQAPPSCTPVVVDSVSFLGSVASFELTRPGEVWVNCTATGSAAATQRLGASAQTSQAKVTSTGRMSFYPGNVPASGTVIRVNYRIGGRSVARMTLAHIISGQQPHPDRRASGDPHFRRLRECGIGAAFHFNMVGGRVGRGHTRAGIRTRRRMSGRVICCKWTRHRQPFDRVLVRSVQIRATSCAPELLSYTVHLPMSGLRLFR